MSVNVDHQSNKSISHQALQQKLNIEFLTFVLNSLRRNPFPVVFALSMIGAFAYDNVDHRWVLGWGLLAATGVFGRMVYLRRQLKNLSDFSEDHTERSIDKIVWLNGGNGAIVSTSLAFFPFITPLEAGFHTLIFGMLTTGVVVSNAGFTKATYPYILFTAIPLAVMWILFPHTNENQWQSYAIALIILMFATILLGISRDIKKLFTDVVESNLAHELLSNQLTTALHESDAANAAKTRFLATASHDLRQPVHTLSLLTASLMRRSKNTELEEITSVMQRSLDSLANQLDSLLDISKLDAGIVPVNKQVINVSPLLNTIAAEFKPLAKEKNLALVVDLPVGATAITDSTLLERLVRNLLSNAIKYTIEGKVTLTCTQQNNQLIITISDTGIGISPENHQLIFEEFYQVDNPHRDKTKGLGLGLSIVQRIVRLLDIQIEMQSQKNEGTTFTLTVEGHTTASEAQQPAQRKFESLQGLKVLVLDDEKDVRLATKVFLEDLLCDVTLAENSEEAIHLAQKKPPDLLIADFRLRNHDSGLDTLRKLRTHWPQLPAIIITGDTAPDRLKEVSTVEASLLHKPIQPAQLRQTIVSLLSR